MNNSEKNIDKYIFRKYDEFWMANIEFKLIETTFEIFEETLNEDLVKRIISEIDNKILELDINGNHLLKSLSETFWGHSKNNVFTFSGFVIDTITQNLCIDFRLCYHCQGQDNFSDFANWYIDIKDFKIVGCSRQQI